MIEITFYFSFTALFSYSARAQLLGNSVDSVVVASGTVFNQILLWHLEGKTSSSRVPVRLSLNGHEVGCEVSRVPI